MRVHLIATVALDHPLEGGIFPILLKIKPAFGLAGEYQFKTDTRALMTVLYKRTDLNGSVLEKFSNSLCHSPKVRLPNIDLPDQALEEMGFFID
jgi:hypothetical protein